MCFDEIVLSKAEMELLKTMAENGPVMLMVDNKDVIMRLKDFDFVMLFAVQNFPEELRQRVYGVFPRAADITDQGRNYLAYQAEKDVDSRRDFRREVLIAVISAAAGSLATLLIEHLPGLFEILKNLLQSG